MSLPTDQLHSLWDELLQRWPLEKLQTMELNDYTAAGNTDSFCNWLEARTEELGSIWGGSAFKFGVYNRKDKAHKQDRYGRMFTTDFAWMAKYGSTPEDAFLAVRDQIVAVANNARAGNLGAIDKADLGEALRWKIAFLYQDRATLRIAPIFTGELLSEITGTPGISVADGQRHIMASIAERDIFEYASALLKKAEEQIALKFSTAKAKEYLDKAATYSPIKPATDKVAGYQSLGGQQLALILSNAKVTLFLEPGAWQEEAKGLYSLNKEYSPGDTRNSNLSANAPTLATGHPAISVTVDSLKHLADLCELYDSLEGESSAIPNQTTKQGEKRMPSESLNQILYGPPGTGKTFATTEIAVRLADPQWHAELCDRGLSEAERRNELKARYDALMGLGQVAFTTFHQSFSYEDFVEGIRAETNDGKISYDVQDGIFKALAIIADADNLSNSALTENIDLSGRRFWKMSLGNTLADEDDAYQDCIEQNYLGLGWGDDIDFTNCASRDAVSQKYSEITGEQYGSNAYNVSAVNTFKNTIRQGDIVVISDGNHKFRAIGEVSGDYQYFAPDTGRWFNQTRSVKWLRVFETSLPKEALFQKSLSQMTLYELRPTTLKMDKLRELLENSADRARNTRNYVLIIDEINRGNVSRVFGELITLLEPDKRKNGNDARSVTLPYSKKSFSVPGNLYVVGTMNTADKSLAQIDLALRRRFEFVELQPAPAQLGDLQVHGVKIADLLDVLNQRIEVLLDRDHTIGHAYFWSLREIDDTAEREAKLAEIFQKRIIPLLQEYFFSDWERIGWVLNDPAKPDTARFIKLGGSGIAVDKLFGAQIAAEIHDRRYNINTAAFSNPAAYQGIMPAQAMGNA